MQQRRALKVLANKNLIEWAELNKLLRKEIRNGLRKFNTNLIKKTIEENKGSKVFKKVLMYGTHILTKIKNTEGPIIKKKKEKLNEMEKYFTDMYNTKGGTKRTTSASYPDNKYYIQALTISVENRRLCRKPKKETIISRLSSVTSGKILFRYSFVLRSTSKMAP